VSTKKTFTPDEAAQIAVEYGRMRVNQIAKSLQELRDRELKKAIIKPHTNHSTGTTSGSGVEDVPPSKINPPGKNDALKTEETPGEKSHGESSASELCKMCGKGHSMEKGCDGMGKSMLKDAKGKVKDNGIVPGSVLPEDKKTEEMTHDGSGGDITKGKKLGKSLADIRKGATPPMAKPPSGKNMNTHVPTSQPAGGMAKEVKEMVVHNSTPVKPPKDADFKAKKDGTKAVYVAKEELNKAGPAEATTQPARPGIFGRLGGTKTLVPPPGVKTSVTQAIPTKPMAAATMHTAGGAPGTTAMSATHLPAKTQVPLGGYSPPTTTTAVPKTGSNPVPGRAASQQGFGGGLVAASGPAGHLVGSSGSRVTEPPPAGKASKTAPTASSKPKP